MKRRFNRFELKYLVSAAQRDAMLEEIRVQMQPDDEGIGGIYHVNTLYYDTRDLAAYRAKLDGIRYRRKLRVRSYGAPSPDPGATVLVEIKQRINRTVQKRRLALPLADAYALCDGTLQPDERPWPDEDDARVASEVCFLSRALHLVPICVIVYQRHAFRGSAIEPGLRITFDHGLWCRPANALLTTEGNRCYFERPDHMVLEVKADLAVPMWVVLMLARYQADLRRFSKYCWAVARLQKQGLLQPGLRGESAWTS